MRAKRATFLAHFCESPKYLFGHCETDILVCSRGWSFDPQLPRKIFFFKWYLLGTRLGVWFLGALTPFLTFKNFIHEQKCASALLNRVFKVFHLKLL